VRMVSRSPDWVQARLRHDVRLHRSANLRRCAGML
jgi:hypothetical protein